eukprot:COSAG06_NODE_41757_length_388_cov_0.712803_1_plen_64_part_01
MCRFLTGDDTAPRRKGQRRSAEHVLGGSIITRAFLEPLLISKRSIYQDRLGTSYGNAENGAFLS